MAKTNNGDKKNKNNKMSEEKSEILRKIGREEVLELACRGQEPKEEANELINI